MAQLSQPTSTDFGCCKPLPALEGGGSMGVGYPRAKHWLDFALKWVRSTHGVGLCGSGLGGKEHLRWQRRAEGGDKQLEVVMPLTCSPQVTKFSLFFFCGSRRGPL